MKLIPLNRIRFGEKVCGDCVHYTWMDKFDRHDGYCDKNIRLGKVHALFPGNDCASFEDWSFCEAIKNVSKDVRIRNAIEKEDK